MIKILAGGPDHNWPADLFENLSDQDIWIGIDFGAYALVQNGITPKKIVGDFDSLTDRQKTELFKDFAQDDIIQVDSHKDETDTELAINVARQYLVEDQQIIIYGATGGRLDHELSNLTILAKENFRDLVDRIRMFDAQNEIYFFNPGQNQIKNNPNYKYLAFMNITPITEFEIIDAQYQLAKTDNQFPVMYPSNQFKNQIVNFSHQQGILMAILSKDKT